MILKVNKLDAESDKAIAVLDTKGGLVWIPKSQVTIHNRRSNVLEIEVPKWLADKYPTLEFEEE